MDKNADQTMLKFAGDLLLSASFRKAMSVLFVCKSVCSPRDVVL